MTSPNHEEARLLAAMKAEESNLARCYLDLEALAKEAGEALHKYGHVLKGVIEAEVVAEVTPEMMNDAELSAAAFFTKLRAAGLLKGGE